MRISALFLLPLGLVAVSGRPTNDVSAAQELAAEGGTFDMSQADMLDNAKNGYAPQPASRGVDIPKIGARGVGDLGAGAFAGDGAAATHVTALQHLLHAHGYNVAVDGAWGPKTSGAVTAFQSAAGLAADGIPGPATLGALVDQIQQGSTGNGVSAAQVLLGVTADGDFGPATHSAAVAFQSSHAFEADGIIGRNTWTALFSTGGGGTDTPPLPPPPSPLPSLPTPQAVLAGQARLLTEVELNKIGAAGRYASAAYCDMEKWTDWSCKHCDGGAPFQKFYTSGGGGNVPPWYVVGNGDTVVVAIRGSHEVTWINNFVAIPSFTSETDFPGRPWNTILHAGFYWNHGRMIKPILTAVKKALPENEDRILVVGHSQGAATATIVATSLQARLSSAVVTLMAFAAPRQGNDVWADYVDETLGSRAQRFTNNNDLVTNVPGVEMGYRHASGEVWKSKDGQWMLCKGQENPMCGLGPESVPRWIDSHNGPYPGNVVMGC